MDAVRLQLDLGLAGDAGAKRELARAVASPFRHVGVYIENGVGPLATLTFDANAAVQPWSDQVATACTNLGKTFASAVVSDDFPIGSKLTLTASSGAKPRKMSLLSKDSRIGLGQGPATQDDPVVHGGSLRVVAKGGTKFDDTYTLDAALWTFKSGGYVFSGGDTIQKIVVKPERQIKISGKSDTLGHELTDDPVAVRVELHLGERRFCFLFGGKTTFTQDQSFVAEKAGPDAFPCPSPPPPPAP